MASTTVGVDVETRSRLTRWVARRMADTGTRMTFDQAINALLEIAENQEVGS